MDLSSLILLIAIAAAAYYMGYQQGRASVRTQRSEPEEPPLPGPQADHLPGPSAAPGRPRSAPPPAAAGEEYGREAPRAGNNPPRRTSKPPPAAAGLMDNGRAASDSNDKDSR